MPDENGKPVRLKDVIEAARGLNGDADDKLMRDMLADYPRLREAVLGGLRGGHSWPASTLKISRVGDDLCVVLECGPLEVERRTHSKSVFGAFEILENDLETQPAKWNPNWRGRQRLERMLLS